MVVDDEDSARHTRMVADVRRTRGTGNRTVSGMSKDVIERMFLAYCISRKLL
jgi:hypothetical protein